jgi:hypothetical protein
MRVRVASALAILVAFVATSHPASAQSVPVQCNAFGQIRTEAQQKAMAVRTAMQKKRDRKEICSLVKTFFAAEGVMLKFLEENKTWCGIPEVAITQAKTSHENTAKFRTAACTEAPAAKPRPPSLSDAINQTSVDTAGNTKTGRGTLDSLNGNPLAK